MSNETHGEAANCASQFIGVPMSPGFSPSIEDLVRDMSVELVGDDALRIVVSGETDVDARVVRPVEAIIDYSATEAEALFIEVDEDRYRYARQSFQK